MVMRLAMLPLEAHNTLLYYPARNLAGNSKGSKIQLWCSHLESSGNNFNRIFRTKNITMNATAINCQFSK